MQNDNVNLAIGAMGADHTWLARRGSLLVSVPFPGIVRGWTAKNDRFEETVLLDILSSEGLSCSLMRPVQVGARLFVVIRLTLHALPHDPGPGIALQGVVIRVCKVSDVHWNMAMLFLRYRMLFIN